MPVDAQSNPPLPTGQGGDRYWTMNLPPVFNQLIFLLSWHWVDWKCLLLAWRLQHFICTPPFPFYTQTEDLISAYTCFTKCVSCSSSTWKLLCLCFTNLLPARQFLSEAQLPPQIEQYNFLGSFSHSCCWLGLPAFPVWMTTSCHWFYYIISLPQIYALVIRHLVFSRVSIFSSQRNDSVTHKNRRNDMHGNYNKYMHSYKE